MVGLNLVLMKVSVVICTYSLDVYNHFEEAVESVLAQTYDNVEVVVVVDGDLRLCYRAKDDWGDHEDVIVHCNDDNLGLSGSRNRGIDVASGDVIAFMDDDAVADEHWIDELVSAYREHKVEAVGGKMEPIWIDGNPEFLPEEFYWLIGVTHRGFPDEGPVRNTFGSNISFRADVLDSLGGFDEQLGRKGERQIQGEETELAARLRNDLHGTLYYSPDASVGHKVFEYRTNFLWLVKRAFWQGYSKQVMQQLISDSEQREAAFLRLLLIIFIPYRIKGAILSPNKRNVVQLIMIWILTVVVLSGYAYGKIVNAFSLTEWLSIK